MNQHGLLELAQSFVESSDFCFLSIGETLSCLLHCEQNGLQLQDRLGRVLPNCIGDNMVHLADPKRK